MDAATIWKFLHIAFMFGAVSIFVGQGMLSGAVARSGDAPALRRVLASEDRFAGTPTDFGAAADFARATALSMPSVTNWTVEPGSGQPSGTWWVTTKAGN